MVAYLGREGYGLEWELRAGRQPCQNGTPAFLKRVLERARQLTDEPLLLCLDSGNDAMENIAAVENHYKPNEMAAPVHDRIKWNLRRESPEHWLAYAEKHGHWSEPRPGQRVARFE